LDGAKEDQPSNDEASDNFSDSTSDVEEQDAEFLVPDYNNKPDFDDICGLRWGKDHYIQFFPSLKRPQYT